MFNLLRGIDYLIGKIIFLFSRKFAASFFRNHKKHAHVGDVKKILCIKLWGLGNLVIIYPLISKIKQRFRDSRLIFLTFDLNKGFSENNPAIDEIIYFKFTKNIFYIIKQFIILLMTLRKEKIDLLINFETFNNISALFSYFIKASFSVGLHNKHERIFYANAVNNDVSKHISQVFSDLLIPLDINSHYKYFNFTRMEKEKDKIENILKRYGISRFICIHPGTSDNFKGKRYRKDCFSELAGLFIEKHNVPIFFIGTRKEQCIAADIIRIISKKDKVFDFTGRTTIWELVELLRKSALFISNDTGPVHIAASLGVNTVVFYGPTAPCRYGPLNENRLIFYKDIKCSPCVGIDYINKTCGNNFACLDFTAQEIFTKVSEKFF